MVKRHSFSVVFLSYTCNHLMRFPRDAHGHRHVFCPSGCSVSDLPVFHGLCEKHLLSAMQLKLFSSSVGFFIVKARLLATIA
jgi:hypothetical protein